MTDPTPRPRSVPDRRPDPPSGLRTVVRVVVGIVGFIVSGFGAFILLLIGVAETTGCFIECDEPNLVVGIPALFGAVTAAAVSVVAVAYAAVGRRASLVRIFTVALVVLTLGLGAATLFPR